MGQGGFPVPQEVLVLSGLLEQRGGERAVSAWTGAHEKLVESLAGRCCCFGNALLCMTGIGIPIVCFLESQRQEALCKWLAFANASVFQPAGLFAKFQTVTIVKEDGDGKSHEEEYSWLAVALTPAEAERLMAEPVFWRPVPCSECTCCGCGPPAVEADCCACLKCCCCQPRCV
jgi:hypothetical protein